MAERLVQFTHILILAALCVSPRTFAAEGEREGALHGFPVLLDLNGNKLADGDFSQFLEGERLRIKLTYAFRDGRRVEELSELRQKPELTQEKWSWRESRGDETLRRFQIDFAAGKAMAEKREGGAQKSWSEEVKIEPGRTFADFGFVLAIKERRAKLLGGAHDEIKTIGFTPKPHALAVDVSYVGLEQMAMGGRIVRGDRFLLRPKIPRIVKVFVKIPDYSVWLANPPPAGFLRMEGPLMEPSDPLIRIDLMGGGKSGPSAAVKRP
jgi:hypothetical protein